MFEIMELLKVTGWLDGLVLELLNLLPNILLLNLLALKLSLVASKACRAIK